MKDFNELKKINTSLIKNELLYHNSNVDGELELIIQEQQKEIERLIIISKQIDILAMHMSEVKAISDGDNSNTLKDVIEYCLYELNQKGNKK